MIIILIAKFDDSASLCPMFSKHLILGKIQISTHPQSLSPKGFDEGMKYFIVS